MDLLRARRQETADRAFRGARTGEARTRPGAVPAPRESSGQRPLMDAPARPARRSSSFWQACATAKLLAPWPGPSLTLRRTSRTPRTADGVSSSLSRPRPRSRGSATRFRSSARRNWPRPRAARSRGPSLPSRPLLPRRTRDSAFEQHLHRQRVAPHRGVDGSDVPLSTPSRKVSEI